jgi:SAM-dependent methyltransferase
LARPGNRLRDSLRGFGLERVCVPRRDAEIGILSEADGRFAGSQERGAIHEAMVTEPNQPTGTSIRGLLFGSVAERYERYRLDYPDELVDTVLRYAGRPVCSALEVGAGTGKATRPFAARGIEVTAIEPDADMAKVLARVTHELPVRPVVTTFEHFRSESRFDLVYAAAAWHWTSPATRWAHAVELLVDGGVLALFGAPAELKDPELSAAVDEIEKRVLPEDDPVDVHPWSIEEMAAIDGVGDVEHRELGYVATTTAAAFVGRLATVSAYLQLAPEQRADALRQVRAVLPDQVDIDATVQLSLARRVDRSVS